jgi:hypothetical protein
VPTQGRRARPKEVLMHLHQPHQLKHSEKAAQNSRKLFKQSCIQSDIALARPRWKPKKNRSEMVLIWGL